MDRESISRRTCDSCGEGWLGFVGWMTCCDGRMEGVCMNECMAVLKWLDV